MPSMIGFVSWWSVVEDEELAAVACVRVESRVVHKPRGHRASQFSRELTGAKL